MLRRNLEKLFILTFPLSRRTVIPWQLLPPVPPNHYQRHRFAYFLLLLLLLLLFFFLHFSRTVLEVRLMS